jgi:hypothetical protein
VRRFKRGGHSDAERSYIDYATPQREPYKWLGRYLRILAALLISEN